LNPKFKKTFITAYKFEMEQPVMFRVYDIDKEMNENALTDDYLGSVVTTLGHIIAKQNFTAPLLSLQNQVHGQISVHCEPIAGSDDKIAIGLRARNIPSRFQKYVGPDAYFIVSRESATASGTYLDLHKSDTVPNSMNPMWKEAKLSVSKICSGDLNKRIRVTVYDKNMQGWGDQEIGHCDLTVAELNIRFQNGTPCVLVDVNGQPVCIIFYLNSSNFYYFLIGWRFFNY
jgi:hypothetical protein